MPAYIHVKKMEEFLEDARRSETPWKFWEYRELDSDVWHQCLSAPSWNPYVEFRRAPKYINGVQYPMPVKTPLKIGEEYWTPNIITGAVRYVWVDDERDQELLRRGFVHDTPDAAMAHFNAIVAASRIEV